MVNYLNCLSYYSLRPPSRLTPVRSVVAITVNTSAFYNNGQTVTVINNARRGEGEIV